jgi:hypothetical protein
MRLLYRFISCYKPYTIGSYAKILKLIDSDSNGVI